MLSSQNPAGDAGRLARTGPVRVTALAVVSLLIAAVTFVSALPARAEDSAPTDPAAVAVTEGTDAAAPAGGPDTAVALEETASAPADASAIPADASGASANSAESSAGAPASAEAPLPDDGNSDAADAADPAPKHAASAPPSFAPPVVQEFTNTPPTGVDDHYEMVQDTSLVTSKPGILSNDYDADGDSVQVNGTMPPSTGELVWLDDPAFRYTPEPGFVGTVTFQYMIHDSAGADSAWTTVTVQVLPTGSEVTLPPLPVTDTYLYTKDTPLFIAAPGVLGNDGLDGAVVSIKTLGVPDGTVTWVGTDGSFLFTPVGGSTLKHQFAYEVCTAVACGTGYVDLFPTADGFEPSGPAVMPGAPVGQPDYYGVAAGTPLAVDAAQGVLANDTDPDGDMLEAISTTTVTQWGTLVLASNGSFVYTPTAGFTGVDWFTYYPNDEHAIAGLPVRVELQIGDGSVNHPPVAVADSYVALAGQPLLVSVGPLANDTDADGDLVGFDGWCKPLLGKVQWSGQHITYTPPAGFTGVDTGTYRVLDSHFYPSLCAPITFDVVPGDGVNTPPVPVKDYMEIEQDHTLTVSAAAGVLANDIDLDGDALEVFEYSAADHGVIVMAPDGSYTYTPDAGFVDYEYIDVQVSDGSAAVWTQLYIGVNPTGTGPLVANSESYFVEYGTVLHRDAPELLANDVFPDGATPTIYDVTTLPEHGTVDWTPEGGFTYTPDAGFTGTDSFWYGIGSGSQGRWAEVTLYVLAEGVVPGTPVDPTGPAAPTDPTDPTDPAPTGPSVPALPGEDDPVVPVDETDATPAPATASATPADALAATGSDATAALLTAALLALAGAVTSAVARLRRRAGL